MSVKLVVRLPHGADSQDHHLPDSLAQRRLLFLRIVQIQEAGRDSRAVEDRVERADESSVLSFALGIYAVGPRNERRIYAIIDFFCATDSARGSNSGRRPPNFSV